MAYWYRGRRYPSKPALKTKVKASLKHLASRAWESIQGGHPGRSGGAGRAHDPQQYPGQVPPSLPSMPNLPNLTTPARRNDPYVPTGRSRHGRDREAQQANSCIVRRGGKSRGAASLSVPSHAHGRK